MDISAILGEVVSSCGLCGFVCIYANANFRVNLQGKPHGLRTGRKLRVERKINNWADKGYKRSHLGKEWAKPFAGCSHAKGIVLEKIGIESKQPNSAVRKCVRVQLIKNGKKIAAFVPNDGCLNYIDENDEVLVAGFGRSGHAKGDIPGVRFKIVKVCASKLFQLIPTNVVSCPCGSQNIHNTQNLFLAN